MNVELLRKVQAHILAHPEQVDMETYLSERTCGTAGCIAGWVLVLGAGMNARQIDVNLNPARSATRELGIHEDAAWVLFTPYGLGCKPGTPEYAAQVFARIDRFIEKHGGNL